MRLLYVSHSCVRDINRRAIQLLVKQYGIEAHIVAPKRVLLTNGRSVACEPPTGSGYRLHILAAMGGNGRGQWFPALASLVLRIRPDIIHVDEDPGSLTALQAILLKRIIGSRVVCSTCDNIYRDNWAEGLSLLKSGSAPRGIGLVGLHFLLHYCLDRLDALITVGEHGRLMFTQSYGYRGRCDVIPLGIDTDMFYPRDATGVREQLGLTKFTIGYFGSLVPVKGVHTLIEACGRLTMDYQLLLNRFSVTEDTAYSQHLFDLAARNGVSERVVTFDARHEDMPQYISAAHCAVLPSITTPRLMEQFGRVIAEAMACGVPVIGSSSGNIPYMIGEDGLIFPEKDAQVLAHSITRLAEDKGLRHDLAQRGRQRAVERHSLVTQARMMMDLYRYVLHPHTAERG